MTVRTLGVEEEFLLIDPVSCRVTAVAPRALRAHQEESQEPPAALVARTADPSVESELFRQMIETASAPCRTLNELRAQLTRGRRAAGESAEQAGAALVAVAAPVLIDQAERVSSDPRYRRIYDEFGLLARGSLACAMHVHVDISDGVDGAELLDRIGPWLPILIAISANSPYWHGEDTGYASWRAQVWGRWPSGGTGERFGSERVYDETTRRLIDWGVSFDDGMIYFGARLSRTYPTLEVRVADVCTDLDDAVLVAALTRGLVEAAASGALPSSEWRSDLIRAAHWRASRYGIADRLVDPMTLTLVSARAALESAIDFAAAALDEAGDLDLVRDLVERLLTRGTGAVRQRQAFERTGELEAVVLDLRARTKASWAEPGTWVADPPAQP
jgi:carboxylate-amine ligase